jgi:hypothetical protein
LPFSNVPPGPRGGKRHSLNPYQAGSELSVIWQLGYDEAWSWHDDMPMLSDVGRTYDDNPESERSHAYDLGRSTAEDAINSYHQPED